MKNKNWVKATIMLASSMTVMAGAAIAASTPKLKEAFPEVENAEFLVKMVISLPALFIAIAAPFLGPLLDRFGRLPFLYFGLVFYSLSGTSGFFLDDLHYILVSRAFLGISVACIMPVTVALVGDYFFGPEREMMTSLQGAAMALGGVVFVGIGGILADISWRYPFLIYLFSLVVLILALVYLKEPDLEKNESEKKGYFNGLTRLHYFLLSSGLVIMLAFYMIPVQIPFLLKSLGINEMKWIALALVTNTIGSVIVAANYKFFRRFLSFSAANGVLLISMALGFFTIYLASSYWMVVVGLSLSGLGLGLFMPNFSLWILEITPVEIRGKAVGLVSSAVFLGQFLSPYFVQPMIGSGLELRETFAIAALILLAISGIYWAMDFKNKRNAA